jgi:hypothetical protein
MHIEGESLHERLGELLVIRSHAEDPVPSSISVVGGREDVQGADQPSGCERRFPCGGVGRRARSLARAANNHGPGSRGHGLNVDHVVRRKDSNPAGGVIFLTDRLVSGGRVPYRHCSR